MTTDATPARTIIHGEPAAAMLMKRMARDANTLSLFWAHIAADPRSNGATIDIACRRSVDYSKLSRNLLSYPFDARRKNNQVPKGSPPGFIS